jgi:hypothetical protein
MPWLRAYRLALIGLGLLLAAQAIWWFNDQTARDNQQQATQLQSLTRAQASPVYQANPALEHRKNLQNEAFEPSLKQWVADEQAGKRVIEHIHLTLNPDGRGLATGELRSR